ncbi:MAG: hypothetical protein AABX89_00490 [Candidatus Thermoplasmatota archaeon]
MAGFFIAVAGGALRLTVKYLLVPVLVSVATALVADEVAKRMRRRTEAIDARLAANRRVQSALAA